MCPLSAGSRCRRRYQMEVNAHVDFSNRAVVGAAGVAIGAALVTILQIATFDVTERA
jgi:hypothetical protein